MSTTIYAGRFDFEDGGTYCGGWEDGKAHGHGVCTGPKSQGEFSGLWQYGYEVSGLYIWPNGNSYQGQWMSGKRHGLGVERKQQWIYKGEWSQGFKGRYGIRLSELSGAKYEGTWANGLQDGYGAESYADGGTYFGQMSQGMRNGYGIRKSVAYGVASRYRSKDVKDSLISLRSEDGDEKVQRERDKRFDENRGGFVLRAKSDLTEEVAAGLLSMNSSHPTQTGNIMTNAINGLFRKRRGSLGPNQDKRVSLRKTIMSKLKKQKSFGDIDDVNTIHGLSSIVHATSSTGRNKKSSFRSTSSNNSVDSRASNRTAPAGLGLANFQGNMMGMHNQTAAHMDDGEHSFISQDEITDSNCIEVYMGEWKQDKRTGYGIAERSDGLKYEGEWFNNKKNGYGVTTFKDGTKEEGKYKNNVLATDKKKSGKLLMVRSSKLRQKIDAAVNAALKAGQIAQQRADIALARAVNARTKAHAAELAAKQSRADSEYARVKAREIAPDFLQPGEFKKTPDIVLEIDRLSGGTGNYAFQPQLTGNATPLGLNDPMVFNPNMSPNQYRKMQPSPNSQLQTTDTYWQQQQHQSHPSTYAQHSPTPPLGQSNMMNNPSRLSNYDQNLMISTHQLHQMHPSVDSKLNNDMQGLNQIDAQTMAQYQNLHPYMSQMTNNPASIHSNPKHQMMQHQNYSFDEQQLTNNYYDRFNALHQGQNHSFNMDMLQNMQNDFAQQQSMYQRNNPRRNTLKRSQRVTDASVEDVNNLAGGVEQIQSQQQQAIRNQQYSNNSSVQESGIGTGSLHTNASGAQDLLRSQKNSLSPSRKNNEKIKENVSPAATQIPRRKSLPSIVKTKSFKEDETAISSSNLNAKNQETFIIENGIRKRVTEKSNSAVNQKNLTNDDASNRIQDELNMLKYKYEYDDDQTPQLPRKIVLESISNLNSADSTNNSKSKRVSMPSIPAYLDPKLANKVMSREEANRLSSLRREELRKNREIENNKVLRLKNMIKNDQIGMFFKTTNDSCIQTDDLGFFDWLKDAFTRYKLFTFVILFNISLAIWFLQMLK